jgi:hypothetical protein
MVNLEQGTAVRRHGLILEILRRLGHRPNLPDEPDDLAEFDRLISNADLFAAMRYLIMTKRKLTLWVQSHTPFAALLPFPF